MEWELAIVRYTKPSDTTSLIKSANKAISEIAETAGSHFDDLCTCDGALDNAQEQWELQKTRAEDAEGKVEELRVELSWRDKNDRRLATAMGDIEVLEKYIIVAEGRRKELRENIERLTSELAQANEVISHFKQGEHW
jgi:chromosome segregation ATPase